MSNPPILYSFRRCPYAIRARMAVAVSGITVELREIVLRDKAPEFLAASPSATVPCLRDNERVVDESLDIMLWALRQNDPDRWLEPERGNFPEMLDLIGTIDGPFKRHLDRYKYDTRFPDAERGMERGQAADYVWQLDSRLRDTGWLFGQRASLADFAILPFIRQFANTDRDWFDGEPWQAVADWLSGFEGSERFQSVMPKWRKWERGDTPVYFPSSV
ncbi:glutathione S-transferase [Rhodobacterales bacterium]|nr:glutathione S-transferase [Rhodobacterales bacterium]